MSPCPAPIDKDRIQSILLTFNTFALLVTTLLLSFVVAPGFMEAMQLLKSSRSDYDTYTSKIVSRDRILEDSRKRVIEQQAKSISQQEELRNLIERNLKLTTELNRIMEKTHAKTKD